MSSCSRRYSNERLKARATIEKERISSAAAAAAVVVVAAAAAKHLLLSSGGLDPSPLRRMLVPFLLQFSFAHSDDDGSSGSSSSSNDLEEKHER